MQFNNTNWNLYKPFIVVYETQNLHRASDILGVSVAAISKNIRELSNQLGTILFNSHQRGVTPTGEATTLYNQVKTAMSQILNAENNMSTFTNKTPATLRIGISSSIVEMIIANYLPTFYSQYPNIQIEIFRGENLTRLEQGKLDLIISLGINPAQTEMTYKKLFDTYTVFIASKDFLQKHNLGTKVPLEKFLTMPIIAYPEVWQNLNLTARSNIIKTQSSELNYSMAKHSQGIAMYSRELLANQNNPEVVEVSIDSITLPTSEVVYIFNRVLSRPAQAFINGLQP